MTNGSAARQPTLLVGADETDAGRDALALGRELAELRGAQLVVEAELRGNPAKALHGRAVQIGAELIVVGSTRPETLVHGSPCPVAVAPSGFARMAPQPVRVVAVGYDLGPESEAAVEIAAELAEAAEATLRIFTVDAPGAERYADHATAAAYTRLPDVRARLRMGVTDKRDHLPAALRADAQVLSGRPEAELLNELDKGVDLMVMGSHGYGAFGRAFLGSVAAGVVRAAPCPVVIVPRSKER